MNMRHRIVPAEIGKRERLHSRRNLSRTAAAVALALIAMIFSGCETGSVRVIDTSRTFNTVVIDAGHGGHDAGTRSRAGGLEKNDALAVARRLEADLRAAGFRTVMTRSDDTFIPLDRRARISNRQDNAVFVSIHFNEARARDVHGAEVHYKSRPSIEIARRIVAKLEALPGGSSRGVKYANFRVLKRNQYPAVLVECGFLSNPSEASRCASGAYQDKLAGAITAALVEQRRR